eukprot:m.33021 g.33021  ORF g.33021 m.33021 type:complete len:300 (+) comp31744_c0_seq4:115-1014(+)
MNRPKKRKQKEDSDQSDPDSDEVGIDSGLEVQVDFEAHQPESEDYHGIKRLLNQLFPNQEAVNLGELTDLILSQNNIGSVIKVCQSEEDSHSDDSDDDDDNLFGLTTVINMRTHQDKACIQSIIKIIEEKCTDVDVRHKVGSLLHGSDDGDTGLLLSERFLNLPPQIALPSYKNLLDDIDKAKKKGEPFHFRHFLIICKSYRETCTSRSLPQAKGKKKKGRAAAELNPNPSILFGNAEEEVLLKVADLKFSYVVSENHEEGTVAGAQDSDDFLVPCRTVLAFPADLMPNVIQQMEELLA